MLFNSYTFIFLFLPVVVPLFYLAVNKTRFTVALSFLVLCSLFFYAYWNPAYLPLLLGSVVFNFYCGKWLSVKPNFSVAAFGVSTNVALIAYYKYADFFISNANVITGADYTLQNVILPLGISFFTFQQITYLVDTYKGNKQNYSLLDYCQFVTFFPQLIAGPIVHHQEMMPQFNRVAILANVRQNVAVGFTLFFLGLFKKVVLADSVSVFATPVFQTAEMGAQVTLVEAWVGSLAYTLQLYFDFSGYSDMAIGLARIFGITLPVNFDSPYKATNIIDFWRRWHITLSRFLRDYIYIPLGGNRKGQIRRLSNIFTTMLIGGLWHGAGWTFIVWGAMHGGFIVINHIWISLTSRNRFATHVRTTWIYRLLSHLLTLLAVIVAWVVFRAESWDAAASILSSMFGLNGIALPTQLSSIADITPNLVAQFNVSFGNFLLNELFDLNEAVIWITALLAVCLFAPNSQSLMRLYKPTVGKAIEVAQLTWQPNLGWALAVSILATVSVMNLSGVTEFLYFNF